MSYPYVIWTMRRTGGTTLATLLSTLSEYTGTQHEPFNQERVFGHIYQGFAQSGDADKLRADLRKCLEKRPLIKHCHELMSHRFNALFLEVTTALGYRHIVLERRNETDRIVSLELAYLTGAWGGQDAKTIYPAIEAGEVTLAPMDIDRALRQMRLCNTRRRELASMITTADLASFVVYFEDVYSDPKAGRALIKRMLAYLDLRPEDHKNYDALVNVALLKSGQNSARILQAVPGAQGGIAQLEAEYQTQTPVFVAS